MNIPTRRYFSSNGRHSSSNVLDILCHGDGMKGYTYAGRAFALSNVIRRCIMRACACIFFSLVIALTAVVSAGSGFYWGAQRKRSRQLCNFFFMQLSSKQRVWRTAQI